MKGAKDQRRRWRLIASGDVLCPNGKVGGSVYRHIQDTRFTLLFPGYGAPRNGSGILRYQCNPIMHNQDWSTALVNRSAYLMANKLKRKTRKQRKRFAK